MNNIKNQRGQAIILLAFAIVGLVGFGALAIDGGRVLSDKRHAQNAADTAALAAALDIIHGGDSTSIVNTARTRALSNGYDDASEIQDVEVNRPPVSGPYAGNSEYVQVIIRSTINTTFARVIGRPQVTNVVQAVARAQGVNTNSSALGAALAAFQKDGTPFTGHGGGDLNVYGSGVFSNASTTTNCPPPEGAMKLTGTINYHVDTSFASPGTVCTTPGAFTDGPITHVDQVEPPDFDIPAPSFTCGPVPNPQLIGTEYQPGTYNGLNLSPIQSLASGNYCFNGNVKFNGGTFTLNNVNIRMNSGTFTVASTTILNCSNVIIYSAGGGGVKMTGGTNNCSGITFYIAAGDVELAGNTTNIFTAPTSGTYKGLLIYLPKENTGSVIKITGTSNSQYTGSIIGISSDVMITGNSDSAGYNVQVLSKTVDLGGTSGVTIHYNPDDLYPLPNDATIELPQ